MPPRSEPVPAPAAVPDEWVRCEFLLPASWKRWLEEAAEARALSVGALVRQCVRDLMIRGRHNAAGSSS